MTIVPPPVEDTAMRAWENPEEQPEPDDRWGKYVPGEPQLRAAAFGTLIGLLVAVLMGAAYGAEPGDSLWALNKTVFTGHSQDVAIRAVVAPLKNAQDILSTGKQPSPDQLTEARTSLNEAKQGMEFISASNERTTLQNLYLQLTQQLRQYTPEQAQQLPALPAPPEVNTDANLAANVGPAAPASSPPSWGYAAAASAPVPNAPQSYSTPPPPGIPVDPIADWPAPVAPPLTPNLLDLGGYDPSWSLLYGYNVLDWFNWGLSGFNRYGYDFMGFDRWGYDRWGYDRWGYDRAGYNWDGYNWSGYNRDGRDRDGRNEWGQFRDDDPRDQAWYDRYHPYRQYYDWKFQNTNPVYSRNLWDQSHGINPAEYRDWNLNRGWDNPLERDWSPVARITDRPALAEPVVNLDASLAQFLTEDKSARPSQDLIKDLSTKSVRNFSKELAAPAPAPAPEKSPTSTSPVDVKPSAPPVLTVPAPTAPPKLVPEDFTPPSLPTVPPLTPAPSSEPRATSGTTSPAPSTEPSHEPTPTSGPPGGATTSAPALSTTSVAPAPTTPKDETSAPASTPATPTHETPATSTPRQTVSTPQPSATAEPSAAPEPTKQRSTPTYEAPSSEAPAPRTTEPAPQPTAEAPAKQTPVERETQPSRASAPETVAPTREAPTREAPTYSTPTQAPSAGGGSGGGYGGGSSNGSGSGGGHH